MEVALLSSVTVIIHQTHPMSYIMRIRRTMNGWMVFVCVYLCIRVKCVCVCVCVPDVYLIIIQFVEQWLNGAGISSLGSSFAEFCLLQTGVLAKSSLFTIIATQCHIRRKLPCPCTCTNISLQASPYTHMLTCEQCTQWHANIPSKQLHTCTH